jgi:hypothetical protein
MNGCRKKMTSRKEKEQGVRLKKKPYLRPEIKQVPLRAEEAVLAACKTHSGTGPAGGPCHGHGGCQGQGS